LIARDATVDDGIDGWFAFDLHSVVGILGVEIHFEVEGEADFSVHLRLAACEYRGPRPQRLRFR